MKGLMTMSEATTRKIKSYSRDEMQTDAFNALLDYYGKSNLLNISEEMGLEFLAKLESGEVRIYG
jgi:hypothetical protein